MSAHPSKRIVLSNAADQDRCRVIPTGKLELPRFHYRAEIGQNIGRGPLSRPGTMLINNARQEIGTAMLVRRRSGKRTPSPRCEYVIAENRIFPSPHEFAAFRYPTLYAY